MPTVENMKRITASCAAILTCVAAVAWVGPVGWASAEETPDNAVWRVGVDFHVADGLSLGDATVSNQTKTVTVTPSTDAAGNGAGYSAVFPKEFDPEIRTGADVTWPIRQGRDGSDTGYIVTSRVFSVEGKVSPASTCWVTRPKNENTDNISCSLVQRGLDNDWDLYLTDDRLNRLVEASGAIKTDGSVKLGEGMFFAQTYLRLAGATEVPVNSSTQFDSVLTPQDKDNPSGPRGSEALIMFEYAIYDGEQPGYVNSENRRLYLRGHVSNRRGNVFRGDSYCEIITADGSAVENYTCTMKSSNARAEIGNGVHYETEFTVSKKK